MAAAVALVEGSELHLISMLQLPPNICAHPWPRFYTDVRMAAAVALAEGSELHPQVVGDALERTIALYNGAGGDEAARAGEKD